MSFQIAVIGNMHCWSKERWVRVKGRYLMTVIWYQVYCVLFLHMNKSSTDLSSMSICTCFEIVCQSQTWGYSCISCFYFLLKRNLTFTSSRHKLALFDIHLTTSKKDHHQQQTKTNDMTNCFVFVKRQCLHGVHREISWRCSDWLSTEMYVLLLSYHKHWLPQPWNNPNRHGKGMHICIRFSRFQQQIDNLPILYRQIQLEIRAWFFKLVISYSSIIVAGTTDFLQNAMASSPYIYYGAHWTKG